MVTRSRRPRSTLPPFAAADLLEPLRLLPVGTIVDPEPGEVLRIHVDGIRHQRNKQWLLDPPEPLIRIIRSDGEIYHARRIRLGPSTLEEVYDEPLPRRTQAVCILRTAYPVEILE